jgi:protein-S-isoprenylcysteine O-methyltransferase Ste14
MNLTMIIRYAVRETIGLIVMGVALFWPAGTIRWWPAWALLFVMLAWTVATAIIILRLHPALLAERLGPRKGSKRWDIAIVGALGITQLARYIVAGFDHRYGWSGPYPLALRLLALVVCIAGYAWFTWATASNRFFAQTVRIQTERDHRVVVAGPYCYMRHPGYMGAILWELASPIVLASSWSIIAGMLGAGLLIARTALEDRTLRHELAGYEDYTHHVPYRLLPGVW